MKLPEINYNAPVPSISGGISPQQAAGAAMAPFEALAQGFGAASKVTMAIAEDDARTSVAAAKVEADALYSDGLSEIEKKYQADTSLSWGDYAKEAEALHESTYGAAYEKLSPMARGLAFESFSNIKLQNREQARQSAERFGAERIQVNFQKSIDSLTDKLTSQYDEATYQGIKSEIEMQTGSLATLGDDGKQRVYGAALSSAANARIGAMLLNADDDLKKGVDNYDVVESQIKGGYYDDALTADQKLDWLNKIDQAKKQSQSVLTASAFDLVRNISASAANGYAKSDDIQKGMSIVQSIKNNAAATPAQREQASIHERELAASAAAGSYVAAIRNGATDADVVALQNKVEASIAENPATAQVWVSALGKVSSEITARKELVNRNPAEAVMQYSPAAASKIEKHNKDIAAITQAMASASTIDAKNELAAQLSIKMRERSREFVEAQSITFNVPTQKAAVMNDMDMALYGEQLKNSLDSANTSQEVLSVATQFNDTFGDYSLNALRQLSTNEQYKDMVVHLSYAKTQPDIVLSAKRGENTQVAKGWTNQAQGIVADMLSTYPLGTTGDQIRNLIVNVAKSDPELLEKKDLSSDDLKPIVDKVLGDSATYGNNAAYKVMPVWIGKSAMEGGRYIRPDELADKFARLRPETMSIVGQPMPDGSRSGMYVDGKEVDPQEILSESTLVLANNKYRIQLKNSVYAGGNKAMQGYVFNKDGKPYELDPQEIGDVNYIKPAPKVEVPFNKTGFMGY